MSSTTTPDISKKDFTEVLFQQLLLYYRAGSFDAFYLLELFNAEFPKQAAVIRQARSSKPKKRRATRRRRAPAYKPDDLLTPFKSAKVLGLAEKTLANMRSAGGGPQFIKLANRTIRYRFSDLNAFIEQGKCANTSQYGGVK